MSSLISTTAQDFDYKASKALQALIVKASGVKPAHKHVFVGNYIDILVGRKDDWDGLNSKTRIRVSTAWYAIEWALATGRLRYCAEEMLKGLTPYQTIKLVARMASSFSTVQACVDFLNGKRQE